MSNKILAGHYKNEENLDKITKFTLRENEKGNIKGNHIWISDIKNENVLNTINEVRDSKTIIDSIQNLYPNYKIKHVYENDEIYYSVSPEDIKDKKTSSHLSLVNCHYDSPYYYFPNNGIIFFRVLVACNENKDVKPRFQKMRCMLRWMKVIFMDLITTEINIV